MSNMAWIEKDSFRSESEIFVLRNKCTIIPKEKYSKDKIPCPIKMYRETETHFGVPRNFFVKNRWSQPVESIKYAVSQGQDLLPNESPILLREYDQEPVAQKLIEKLKENGNWGCGLMEAFVAFGKTVVSIEVINRLGGNAIVLVHSEALKDQWVERIKSFYPNARIGEIQADVCNYKDKDIVVGMVQSLMSDSGKYPPEVYRHFRTMVVDECHIMGSKSFGKAAPKFHCKYMFGVSGTMRRADGCVDVFKWTLGDIAASADESLRVKPHVYLRSTGLDFPRREWQYTNKKTGKVENRSIDYNQKPRSQQLNYLSKSKERNKKIAVDIVKALRSGRNPLVMSERKDMLEDIAAIVDNLCSSDPKLCDRSISHGFYFGGKSKKTRKQELEAASKCDVVYATIQLAKVGIDIPRLETLFMASPLADVEQLVGRVCRPTIKWVNGKPIIQKRVHHSMVVDYVDIESSLFKGLYFKRLSQYRLLDWQIVGKNF